MQDNRIITFEELQKKYESYIKNQDERDMVVKAYKFACTKYEGKKRHSGEDYIYHPIYVAYLCAKLNVDYVTIVGALLHECINHTDTSREELLEKFGEEITKIVVSISKINRLQLSDDKQSTAANLRKILVGLSEDVRVLFIKLCDRLHNMRTIWALGETEQKMKANETINVLIPIAHRLGINSVKSELEDLCLRYTKPEIYADIEEKLNNTKNELSDELIKMKESISSILSEHEISFEIKGRVKSVHSIYNKMSNGKKFSDIYDVLALRVFLEKESDCYLAVGLIHSKFRPMPRRFKDYIAMPKDNMYQSLHTTIFGVDGYLFEVQLRTYEMDEIAEKGIASHWSYKEKSSSTIKNVMDQKLELYRNIIESHNEEDSDIEFANALETEFLSEYIYCFTPKGDVVELPRGATPIDFAYRIHSRVGDTTVGAIVNDCIVPLSYSLEDGDIIKINTNSSAIPNKDWLKIVKTTQAKNKIKSYFSKQDKDTYIEKGRELLEKEIRRQKLVISDVLSDENMKKLVKDLKVSGIEEIYLSVGSLRYTSSYIISVIFEDRKSVQDILLEKVMNSGSAFKKSGNNDIVVAGIDDILVNFAKCCKPVYGDCIVGYITKGQGVSIHNCNCPNVKDLDERIIDVSWSDNPSNNYLTNVEVEVESGKNYLADIITKASLKNVYIDSVSTKNVDFMIVYSLVLKVKNKEELDNFIVNMEKESYIKSIKRVNK